MGACGTAGAWSPRIRSTSSTPAARCRPRPTAGGASRSGTRPARHRRWSEPARFRTGLRAGGAVDRARRAPTTPACRSRAASPRIVRRTRCSSAAARARTCAGRSTLDRRGAPGDALRDRPRRGRAAAQRHARRRRGARARAGPTTASGSSTRRTTSPSSCATATTCSAAILGDGWYAGFVGFDPQAAPARTTARDPELLCELHIEHEDGSVEVVASDEQLARDDRARSAYSDLLQGEHYDARRELGGWTEPGYDDGAWPPSHTRARRRRARARARAADPRDRGAAAGGGHRARAGRPRLRPRPEHGRLGAARGRGRARHGGAAALRRDARARRHAAPGEPARRAAARHLRPARRRPSRSSSRASRSTASATSR